MPEDGHHARVERQVEADAQAQRQNADHDEHWRAAEIADPVSQVQDNGLEPLEHARILPLRTRRQTVWESNSSA
jgi:hypothetical protein